MDTDWLVVFTEIARLGSFTAAARALGYTQSAVSRQVASLEGDVGVSLFDRLPRGIRLTEEGRQLLPHAVAVLDRLRTARDELADLRALAAGRLRLGAFANANAALVPRAMAAFKTDHPDVTLLLTEGSTRTHLAQITAGDLDLAVVTTPGSDATAGVAGVASRIELHHLADDPLFVAIPRDHALASRRTVRLAELADDIWIAGDTRIDDTLLGDGRRADFRPRVEFVAAEWVAKLGMVASGLGVTAVPWLAADATRPDVALIALHTDDVPTRRVAAALPKGGGSTAAAAFLRVLGNTVRTMRRELRQRT